MGRPTVQPLESFYYFTQIVEHGGFARAARALGVPKSRLSRHLMALEAQLNVRLLNRSTRRFAVTEVGEEVYRHAAAMRAEAEAALEAVEFARAEPRGTIRAACPVALAQSALALMLPEFLAKYPAVRLQLHVSNRRVDVLREGLDLAVRVRSQPSGEDGLVMRAFGRAHELLVASPAYLARAGAPASPEELRERETLDYGGELDRQPWELTGKDGQSVQAEHNARVICHDFIVLRAAALAGLGIAKVPDTVVREDLRSGALTRVLPDWNSPQGIVHAVFPSRRGLLPAVRAFIDFLAERIPSRL
jgi:DNA-binding transcriptional LysR family regulator